VAIFQIYVGFKKNLWPLGNIGTNNTSAGADVTMNDGNLTVAGVKLDREGVRVVLVVLGEDDPPEGVNSADRLVISLDTA
jgi:hypothetical protein